MALWRSQTFRQQARTRGHAAGTVDAVVASARYLQRQTPQAPPIFSLRHLAHLTNTDYVQLRRVTSRDHDEPYRSFRILKRPLPGEPARYRIITVPSPWLMRLQRWITQTILIHRAPHEASTAFSPGSSLMAATTPHCGANWLIKIDLKNFFETITEAQVYRVFEAIGYQPLVALELARLTTRVGARRTRRRHQRFLVNRSDYPEIPTYIEYTMGHLPQGAPTSPMLANLAALELDEALTKLAEDAGLTYTRYADDLAFSTPETGLGRAHVQAVIASVYQTIADNMFSPNRAKTVVSPPGARKILLGLNVDRDTPKLSRTYKAELRKHLHYLTHADFGPAVHAQHCGGATTHGLRRHVLGLIQHARQIEPDYGDRQLALFNQICW